MEVASQQWKTAYNETAKSSRRKSWIGFVLYACMELFRVVQCTSLSVKNVSYRCYASVELKSPCLLLHQDVRSLLECVVCCSQQDRCESASYQAVKKTCCVSDVQGFFAFNTSIVYVEETNSRYCHKEITGNLWYGDWALVFRAVAGSGISVYQAWIRQGYHDDAPFGNTGIELGCLTLNESQPCTSYFRSDLLDRWSSLNVQEVSIRLYANAKEVVNVVFNGAGSDTMSWMTPARLLQSPWKDATPTAWYNLFGVDPIPVHQRYFFINRHYGGCPADTGWLCIADPITSGRTQCEWESAPKPAFFYSTEDVATIWQGENATVGRADVFAVFIKF